MSFQKQNKNIEHHASNTAIMTSYDEPQTMRAYTHTRRGAPSTVLTLSAIPIPRLTSRSEILIRVSHAALNPGASIIMHLLPFFFRSKVAVPEMDFAGWAWDIEDVDENIDGEGETETESNKLKKATPVFGSIPLSSHARTPCGSLSEYIVVPKSAICPVPANASLEECAGLGIAGATALEVVKKAELKKGDSVLVIGAAGGIGHLVVQLVRHAVGESGRVVGVCGGQEKAQWVRELGCNEVVDYQKHSPVEKYLAKEYAESRFSAILDCAGLQPLYTASPAILLPSGPYASVGPRAASYTYAGILGTLPLMLKNMSLPAWLGGVPRRYVQATGVSNAEMLRELASLVKEGVLRVGVGMCVSMDDEEGLLRAYEALLNGQARGKIVVRVAEEDLDG